MSVKVITGEWMTYFFICNSQRFICTQDTSLVFYNVGTRLYINRNQNEWLVRLRLKIFALFKGTRNLFFNEYI